MTQRIFSFGNRKADGNGGMKDLLGGKGAGLAEMNLLGVPVPPGFTITTACCNDYYSLGKEKVVDMLRPEVQMALEKGS